VSLSGGSGAGDAKSVIKGGGSDLTRATGQMNELVPGQKKRGATDLEEVKGALHAIDVELLQSLKDKLDRAIDESETLRQFRNQLLVDITTEGLRVQIVDARNRPMFAMGSSALQPYTRDILREVGKVLNAVPNGISLSGHTDAAPYSGGERGYSNWELSADRSNAARRELLAGGMAEERIARVIGLGSAVLLDSNDPLNPINRRVSIIVMNREAEEAARRDGGILRADSAVAVKEGIGVQPR